MSGARRVLHARGSRLGAILAVALLGTGLAACGSSDDSGTTSAAATSSGGSDTATSAVVGGSGASDSKDVTDYQTYTRSKPGKADPSLSPIGIGFVNNQGGQITFPGASEGAEAAVKMINEELGGVDGHPVKLVTCFIKSAEEEGTTCAQKMVNDDTVKVVNIGTVVFGNESFHATMAGQKPVIFSTATNPSDTVAKNTVIYIGDLTHVLSPAGPFAKDQLKASSAAVVYRDNAGNKEQGAAYTTGYKKAGLNVKSVGFSAQTTDLLPALTAAGAQTADVTSIASDATGCVPFYKSLQQMGSKTQVIANPLCFNQQLKEAYGGDIPKGWIEGTAGILPQDTSNPAVKLYRQKMEQYGASDVVEDVFAQISFADIVTTLKLINESGGADATPDKIGAAARAFKGPVPMGPPTIDCGQVADAPNVCNTEGTFYRYEGNGKFTPMGGWIPSP